VKDAWSAFNNVQKIEKLKSKTQLIIISLQGADLGEVKNDFLQFAKNTI
jgi:hypothetical protein